MANRKLTADAQALDELLAQSFDKRSVLGKNIDHLYDAFVRGNNTEGIAMLRGLGRIVQAKGLKNVDDRIDVKVGQFVKGDLLEKGSDAREEIGRGAFSGQRLVQGYQISYTVAKQDGTTAQAGYVNGTRLDSEALLGIDHTATLLLYAPLLNNKDLPKILRTPAKAQERKRVERIKKTLPDVLKTMPPEARALAAKHNVDLEALSSLDVLQQGKHLAKGEWSALFFALDAGKNRNELNWYKQRAKEGDLPADVLQAWAYLKTYPHLVDSGMVTLLGAYQLQERKQRRQGIAGMIADEIRWLGTSGKAEQARTLYRTMCGKEVDLTQKHEPARFYKGDITAEDKTIGQKVNDPYWTVADREGMLRKFPLRQFRREYNDQLLKKHYDNDVRGFDGAIQHLRQVRDADKQRLKRALPRGKEPELQLKDNYAFVNELLERMKDKPTSREYKRENLLNRTPIDEADAAFTKLRKTEWFLRPWEERGPQANYGRKS